VFNNKSRDLTRRDFLRTVGAIGAGAALGRANFAFAQDNAQPAGDQADADAAEVPTRPFGTTGQDVSILSFGGTIDTSSQLLLKQAINYGVTYWDTAFSYGGGNSERGFGNYFAANSEDRDKVFLVTKSYQRSPAGLTEELTGSLERLQTDHVDLYCMHGITQPGVFTDEIKTWVENAKSEGKIRFFGFSCHENMSICLAGAAELGWIDGAMFTYNFRTMVLDKALEGKLEKAVDAAHKAGMGLTGMKTQAKNMQSSDLDAEQALLEAFTPKGYSLEQAALKAVWADQRIACICAGMPNTALLSTNVAAAVDKTSLTTADRSALARYAAATSSDYCAACGECRRTLKGRAPVCDVMRYVMYYKIYGQKHEAREMFAALPAETRRTLTSIDYTPAERRCPQNVPIAQRMREAAELLA